MIFVESKRKSLKNLTKKYPTATILDVTSKAPSPFVELSPFYPHGNIPIPFSLNIVAQSVEGIWQGLKVFEAVDIDTSKFDITTMKGLKRTVRKFGLPKGHRKGVNGTELLDYITARKLLYLPAYYWVLEHKVVHVLNALRLEIAKGDLVLLDYETNIDIENPKKPLSHAGLVKQFLEENP